MLTMITMNSFRRQRELTEKIVARLSEFTGVSPSLVANIVQFVKCLCRNQTDNIDDLAFYATLAKRFNITTQPIVSLIFESNKVQKNTYMTVEECSKCFCVFVSDNLDLKIDYIFRVYDVNKDHTLSSQEINTLLKGCLYAPELEDSEYDEAVKEIVDMAMSAAKLDKNREFSQEDFRFVTQLSGKTVAQVRHIFQNERQKLLNEVPPPEGESLYPFELELP